MHFLAVVNVSPKRGLWPVFTLFSAAVATAASFSLFPLSPLHVVFVSPQLRWLAIFASVLYQLSSALRISSTYSKEHCPSALQAIGQLQMAQAERQQQRASGWQRQQRQQHVQHLLHAGLEVLLQVSSVHDSRAFFSAHGASGITLHCTARHSTLRQRRRPCSRIQIPDLLRAGTVFASTSRRVHFSALAALRVPQCHELLKQHHPSTCIFPPFAVLSVVCANPSAARHCHVSIFAVAVV